MKRITCLILITTLLLVGCDVYAYIRPQCVDGEIWVCEEPYIYFYFDSNEKSFLGRIGKENSIDIHKFSDYGVNVFFCDISSLRNSDVEGSEMFRGEADYQEGYFDLEVTEDYENIFGGELPVIRFTRYTVDEFNEKFGEIEPVSVDTESVEQSESE